MKIYTIAEILTKLNKCVEENKSFSHIRFGDGGIKFLHAVLFNDIDQLKIIVKKEGIPYTMINEVFELWGYYTRRADFIDCPEVYFGDKFWPRMRGVGKSMTQKTAERMSMWKLLYRNAEFDNENYCNPESNYLMLLRDTFKFNLIDFMKGKKIGIITAKPEIGEFLREKDFDVDVVGIVGHYQDQYNNSFHNVISIIEKDAKKYDVWLTAAGELGRLYTGYIKECGGRAVDIGFVIEFWLGEELHNRLTMFMNRSPYNQLEIELTEKGKMFKEFI
jgi:hypothetical protein